MKHPRSLPMGEDHRTTPYSRVGITLNQDSKTTEVQLTEFNLTLICEPLYKLALQSIMRNEYYSTDEISKRCGCSSAQARIIKSRIKSFLPSRSTLRFHEEVRDVVNDAYRRSIEAIRPTLKKISEAIESMEDELRVDQPNGSTEVSVPAQRSSA
jgi:hypothetical protein